MTSLCCFTVSGRASLQGAGNLWRLPEGFGAATPSRFRKPVGSPVHNLTRRKVHGYELAHRLSSKCAPPSGGISVMLQMRNAILAFDDQKLPLQRNIGDAFAVVCRFLGGHMPNGVAGAFQIDRKTARNALDGKAGVPVITKALQARQKAEDDHYELWLALGQMIFGESLDEWEERRLNRIIESNAHAVTTLEQRRQRRQELRSFAAPDVGSMGRRRA